METGSIGVLEADDVLLDAVLKDLEVALGQVLHEAPEPSSTVQLRTTSSTSVRRT